MGQVDLKKLSSKLQALLEVAAPISIKVVPFILPESSGKYLSIKLKQTKGIRKEADVC